MARVTLTLAQLVTVTATTSLPALLSSTEEGRTEYLGVAGGLAAAITVAWPVWRVILCIQRRFPARARQKGPDVEPGLCDQPEDQDDRWAVLVDQSTRLWPPAGDEGQMQAELVDLEAKENVEVRYAEGFQPLDPCESAASQLRLFSQKRQGQTSPVKGNSQSNQDFANEVGELGTVHAEAGNRIEASDAQDVSKPQPLQADLKQGHFVGRPALQLRNFRSFDGNAAGKDGAGKAERGARGESGNVTLPGSVPVTAAADGFDLVAEAAREAQPGAQLEEEQTTKNQDSANHVSGLATVGIEASDAPDISKTVTEPSQTDLKQELSIRSPAIQLRHLRSQKSVSPKFRKDPRAGRGSSESPHALAGGRRRPFSEAESRSRPSRSSRSASPERVVETKKKSDGTNGIAAQLVEDKADLGELGEPEAVQSEENCNGQLSPALNLRDLRSSMALHQQRNEELEKCVANFAQSEQFHQCIMQTEQAHALLQQLLPQGKPGQPGKSEDSPKRLQQQQPYLLSVALKRAGETEPAVKLDLLASDGARPSMP